MAFQGVAVGSTESLGHLVAFRSARIETRAAEAIFLLSSVCRGAGDGGEGSFEAV